MITYRKYRTYKWLRRRNIRRRMLLIICFLIIALLGVSLFSAAQNSQDKRTLSPQQIES